MNSSKKGATQPHKYPSTARRPTKNPSHLSKADFLVTKTLTRFPQTNNKKNASYYLLNPMANLYPELPYIEFTWTCIKQTLNFLGTPSKK